MTPPPIGPRTVPVRSSVASIKGPVLSNFEMANPNRINRNLVEMFFGRGRLKESVD